MSIVNKVAVIIISALLLTSCNNNPSKDVTININTVQDETVFSKDIFLDNTLNHYFISADIDTERNIINAKQKVKYTNTEKIDLEELYFHLYPNAFDKDKHPSLFDADKDEIDTQDGYIEIESIKINGIEVDYEITEVYTVLKIYYESKFIIDDSYDIELIYTVGIPTASERFGVVNGLYNLGNWYPVLAVYDEDGWNIDPYYSIGDPFYSDVSNYDVEITVPSNYVLSSSGYISELSDADDMKTYKLVGERIRDFAMSLSDRFDFISNEIDGTLVSVYYPNEFKNSGYLEVALEAAVNAIELYSGVIGEYPYKTYNVIMTNFPTGMEYPGMVLISTNYLDNNPVALEQVIVHETAHQWFYGIIGNDQVDDGWIDEGFTSYMTSYYDLIYNVGNNYASNINRYESRIASVGGKDNVIMLKPASEFDDWNEYGLAAYTKAPLMLSELYKNYGEEKFIEFVRTLYNEYKFKVLDKEGLLEVGIKVFDEDINEFFIEWLK